VLFNKENFRVVDARKRVRDYSVNIGVGHFTKGKMTPNCRRKILFDPGADPIFFGGGA